MRYSGWKPNCFDSHKVWSKPESACDIACCISHAEGCCEAAPISMSIRIMLDDQTSKGPQTPVMSFVIDQGQSVALAVSKRDSQVAKGPAIIFWYGRSTTGMSRWVFVVFARSLASDECQNRTPQPQVCDTNTFESRTHRLCLQIQPTSLISTYPQKRSVIVSKTFAKAWVQSGLILL